MDRQKSRRDAIKILKTIPFKRNTFQVECYRIVCVEWIPCKTRITFRLRSPFPSTSASLIPVRFVGDFEPHPSMRLPRSFALTHSFIDRLFNLRFWRMQPNEPERGDVERREKKENKWIFHNKMNNTSSMRDGGDGDGGGEVCLSPRDSNERLLLSDGRPCVCCECACMPAYLPPRSDSDVDEPFHCYLSK